MVKSASILSGLLDLFVSRMSSWLAGILGAKELALGLSLLLFLMISEPLETPLNATKLRTSVETPLRIIVRVWTDF